MKYKAIFSTQKGTKKAEIDSSSFDYFYPLIIDEMTIETDGFELLSIDNPERYTENQLAHFEYVTEYPYEDKNKKLLVLKNYQLEVFIPIRISEIKTGKKITTDIQITMKNNGGENIQRKCSLLGKSSENYDMEVAFKEVQSQLSEFYFMETCSNCKNSWWSIYGGSDFFNHLCFKNDIEGFQGIIDKNKMTVAQFMKYDEEKNWQIVQLTDYCEKFEPQ